MSGRGPRGRARKRSDVAQSTVTGLGEAAETGRVRGIHKNHYYLVIMTTVIYQ